MQQQYKNGKNVYNYIAYTDAKTKAEGLYTKSQNNVISRLCSGYAWNTALKFIETKYTGYGTNGKESNYYGNYADVTFTYTAIDGSTKIKNVSNAGTGTIVPTGQTIPVNNIYDMGGNITEFTTEQGAYIGDNTSYMTHRGGAMKFESSVGPAAVHWVTDNTAANSIGFRITLFL